MITKFLRGFVVGQTLFISSLNCQEITYRSRSCCPCFTKKNRHWRSYWLFPKHMASELQTQACQQADRNYPQTLTSEPLAVSHDLSSSALSILTENHVVAALILSSFPLCSFLPLLPPKHSVSTVVAFCPNARPLHRGKAFTYSAQSFCMPW